VRTPALAAPPDPPELPEAARPRWPPWYAPVALVSAFGAIMGLGAPLFPLILISTVSETLAAVTLLVLLLFQDSILIGAALAFAALKRKPRRWHFGVRATRFWPTAGWAALGVAVTVGFELAYVALLNVDETNVDDLGKDATVAGLFVALAVIVVAPVAEELFFRGFFYRALRTRLRVWSAALIDGLVFGSLHFQGIDMAVVLPIIAVFGIVQCLIYERTGSLFAVIAVHAGFNMVAMLSVTPWWALGVGLLTLAACVLVPRRIGPGPSPFGNDPRARAATA
jgi:uncharacterized protein